MDSRERLVEARKVSEELLDGLENGSLDINKCLMKAVRLARLMRDEDAQRWLGYECIGYPSLKTSDSFGTCNKYFQVRKSAEAEGNYYTASLPELEATLRSRETTLAALKFPAELPSVTSSNPNEFVGLSLKVTVNSVLDSFKTYSNALHQGISGTARIFGAAKSGLHAYATDTNLAISLGDMAAEIFEKARLVTDKFVRATSPKAAQQLIAAYERVRAGHTEECAQALTSCRRVLCTVADAVYPPSDDAFTDTKGIKRKVGPDEYKNRLLAFIESNVLSKGTAALLDANLGHLAARLDTLYEKTCKGVHADVGLGEARLTIINTYLLLAEVANIASTHPEVGVGSSNSPEV
jgi:hypothetical protein